ncbi:hypothetical protein [Streptomyces sp. Ag82_O1-15]|uniref:hypothetical protein n=1 Tax=Streptomyces sp. Ag82_O1-15 TaxID=1938855 RepID=UPI000BB0FA4A|nr:hypothetical protein [Streptomyces sp. Ag82_O1-15]
MRTGPLVDALIEHLVGDLGRYALENGFHVVVEGADLYVNGSVRELRAADYGGGGAEPTLGGFEGACTRAQVRWRAASGPLPHVVFVPGIQQVLL